MVMQVEFTDETDISILKEDGVVGLVNELIFELDEL